MQRKTILYKTSHDQVPEVNSKLNFKLEYQHFQLAL